MDVSAISGFNPALSLISALSPTSGVTSASSLGSISLLASSQASISNLGRLLNAAETLQKAAGALAAPGAFAARTVTPSAAGVTAATATAATPTGTYAVEVNQLAQAQTLTTAAQPTSLALIGDGTPTTLTFQFASGVSRSVSLGSGARSLSDIASAINGADIGITAKIDSSNAGYALTLTGQTGAANAFTLAVNGDATLAGLLAYPDSGGEPTLTRAAQDAKGLVNGVAFNASTNTVNNAVPGLVLDLQANGSTSLNVTPNTDQAKRVSDFVEAYNGVQAGLLSLGGDNPITGLNATFLRNQLAGTLDTSGSNSSATLVQAGITTNSDGTLNFDAQKFQAALNANPDSVASLFRNDGQGVAEQVAALAGGPLSPPSLSLLAAPALGQASTFAPTLQNSQLAYLLGGGNEFGNSNSFLTDQFFLAALASASGQNAAGQSSSSLLDALLSQNLSSLSSQLDLINQI